MIESVAIVGMGCVSPYGCGVELFWSSLSAGVTALGPIKRFDASPYRNNLGGEVPTSDDFPADKSGQSRVMTYAYQACLEAWENITWKASTTPEKLKVGLILGTNFAAMRNWQNYWKRLDKNLPASADSGSENQLEPFISPLQTTMLQRSGEMNWFSALCDLLIESGVPLSRHLCQEISISCASGAAAIAIARQWIRCGRADVVLCGGVDELSETAVAGLSALRAISRTTVRPFDQRRDGTIFSEGAGVMALSRGDILSIAEKIVGIAGAAINNDAYHMTAPDKTGAGIVRMLKTAINNAGLRPGQIGHINCHGTGTPYNDAIETASIKEVFQDNIPILTAIKGTIGHTMGAAGALESIATAKTLICQLIPPTLNSEEPDPLLDLPICRENAISYSGEYAISNSFGLGGANACIILSR